MVACAVLAVALFGTPLYSMISEMVTHGIHKTSDPVGMLYDVNLKSLGNFSFEPRTGTIEDVPKWDRAMDGKRVVLDGFMAPPTRSAAGLIGEFEFVYDRQICCFGGPPLVQERVFAFLPKGRSIHYIEKKINVTGVLHVDTKSEAGQVIRLYTMDVESLEE